MAKNKSVRVHRDLWAKLQKAVADYDFSIEDLIEFILSDVDLDEYSKKLASKLESDEETAEEEVEQGTEEEEDNDETEEGEEADDEEENFGKY